MANIWSKIRTRVVHILSCCENGDDATQKPLEIGYPTDFRRMDITLSGLTPEVQEWYREKAALDAARIMDGHSPSVMPSPTFAHGNLPHPLTTTPVTPPQTSELAPLVPPKSSPLCPSTFDKVRQHTRRLSQCFSFHDGLRNNPYEPVHAHTTNDTRTCGVDSAAGSRRESFDIKAFEDKVVTVTTEWTSPDSVTLAGSEREDSDRSLSKSS